MTVTPAPLWAVAACRVSADAGRTPLSITAADMPAERLTAALAPANTLPEEGS